MFTHPLQAIPDLFDPEIRVWVFEEMVGFISISLVVVMSTSRLVISPELTNFFDDADIFPPAFP